MVYHGRVQNGKIELDDPVSLPEGAFVTLSILIDGQPADSRSRRVIELLQRWHAAPDKQAVAYWDDLERELVDNRLSFRDPAPRR